MQTGRTTARTLAACLALGGATAAGAEVTDFEIQSREVAYDGQSFGEVGSYTRIEAEARIAVAPDSDRAGRVAGIEAAPTDADGRVTFTTEVVILTPTETESAAPVLFYDVPNRGRNLAFPLLNLSAVPDGVFTTGDPGDGFLMRRGYTMVWSGWQTGLGEELLDMELPVLDGVTGTSREEFVFDDTRSPHTAELSYPAADTDPAAATLTVRQNATEPRKTPEGLSLRYVDADTVEITRPEGMDAGAIYELVYPATDPEPSGLGFVATSDVVSFLRGRDGHEASRGREDRDAESPLPAIEHTVALGISQSGRYLRDFLYQGFNADAAGETVFDGVMPHIAGSRKTFTNYLFAQPGRYSRQHQDHDFPGDQFPFTYPETTDPLTGRTDGILAACTETDTCPRVIQTDTSTEFWQARASLVSTTPDGAALDMPADVRLFFLAGAPHYNGWDAAPSETPVCVYDSNPLSVAPTMRALVPAMVDWVSAGTAPPDSVYPDLDDALVQPEALELPRLDGEVPQPALNRLRVRDHSQVPPEAGAEYPVFVPRVDADGIPEGGVREPYVAAPLGTYLGWNLRAEGYAPGELCGLTGSYIPFSDTPAENDARRPVSARYDSEQAYRDAVRAAAGELAERGLMRRGDIDRVVDSAPAGRGFD